MYRRILGYFTGGMSENSEEDREKSNVNDQSSKDKKGSETSAMASGEEGAALRDRILKLEKELEERLEENESYKNRLQLVEQELAALKQMSKLQPVRTSVGVGDNNVHSRKNSASEKGSAELAENDVNKLSNENTELENALSKVNELLKNKTDLCDNQEKQNLALTNQVASLKEVITITKDLLNIRNMEVRHLKSDVESMEGKIAEEKRRHNTMISKMDEAVKLNSDLKTEYETQLKIFQDLKSKYEDKVAALMKENKALEGQIPKFVEEPKTDNQDTNDDNTLSE
ncbi:hypothetical protein L9F63_004520 [Diploptera punctata]|uniref:Uncharacterized protein n=1 Tax=Diploptera punctata TaxID=6984 RepID=A0AAD7ZFK8_DIPPU|nr:hypothetical protein L9F63_004520 [Diploptera punctata]